MGRDDPTDDQRPHEGCQPREQKQELEQEESVIDVAEGLGNQQHPNDRTAPWNGSIGIHRVSYGTGGRCTNGQGFYSHMLTLNRRGVPGGLASEDGSSV